MVGKLVGLGLEAIMMNDGQGVWLLFLCELAKEQVGC
jgi:hypothetical protein